MSNTRARGSVACDLTALLLGALGHRDDEFTSLFYENGRGPHTAVMAPVDAVACVDTLPPDANIFFGINPTRGPARKNTDRGGAADITRLAALWADLDVKPGACKSLDAAEKIIDELSGIVGTRPSVVVYSGGGLHAYWPIEDGALDEKSRGLPRRWGRLVAAVAHQHDARVDNVYDLARMLRIPGTINNKNTPVPVLAYEDVGGPLTVAEVDERLTELGICPEADDTADTAIVSDPTKWKLSDTTCSYVAALIDGLPDDGPKPGGGRHPWLCSQAIRLTCAARLGCVSAPDLQRAADLLAARFTELCTAEPCRKPGCYEIDGAWKLGEQRASVKTEEQARAELGGHAHDDQQQRNARGEAHPDEEYADKGAEGTSRLWSAAELKPAAQPSWLAKNRLQRAAINLLIGDEGIGKSLLWVWIAAAVTTGKALPEFGIPARDPSRVILVCTEDDWTTVVRPRLEVAGAELARVAVVCIEPDGSGAPTFPDDLHLIADTEPAPVLVVVDCWLDTVPASLSVRDPQQARLALHPWKELATKTGAAVLLLAHTNRVASPNARDRYGATGVLRQKVRLTLFAQSDDDGRLIVGPEKANSTAAGAASIFTITVRPYWQPTADSDGTVPLLRFVGTSDRTAREHVTASATPGDDEPGGNPAKVFVVDYVTRNGYEVEAAKVLKAGRAAGFSEQELKDARRRCRKPRISSRKASMEDGWVWAIDPPQGPNLCEGREGGA